MVENNSETLLIPMGKASFHLPHMWNTDTYTGDSRPWGFQCRAVQCAVLLELGVRGLTQRPNHSNILPAPGFKWATCRSQARQANISITLHKMIQRHTMDKIIIHVHFHLQIFWSWINSGCVLLPPLSRVWGQILALFWEWGATVFSHHILCLLSKWPVCVCLLQCVGTSPGYTPSL